MVEQFLSYMLNLLGKSNIGRYILAVIGGGVCIWIFIVVPLQNKVQTLQVSKYDYDRTAAICESFHSAEILTQTWINDSESLPAYSGQLLLTAKVNFGNVDLFVNAGEENNIFRGLVPGERKEFNFNNEKLYLDVLKIDNTLGLQPRVEIALSRKI